MVLSFYFIREGLVLVFVRGWVGSKKCSSENLKGAKKSKKGGLDQKTLAEIIKKIGPLSLIFGSDTSTLKVASILIKSPPIS